MAKGKPIKAYQKGLKDNMVGFTNELTTIFPDLRVTSVFREGAKTKQGNVSRHSLGEAVDIEDRKDIYDYLWNTREGITLLNKYSLGVLDETSPEMLAKTDGTGAHYHIGADSTIVPKAKQRYNEIVGEQKAESTTTLTNFDIPIDKSNFVSVPDVVETKEPEKKEESLNKLKEDSFLKDYKSLYAQQEIPQQELQNIQIQDSNLEDIYNQVSNFVDTTYAQQGKIIKDNNGYWNPMNWGKTVEIQGGQITMKGVKQPLIGYSPETGEKKLMTSGNNYNFKGATRVIETPLKQNEIYFLNSLK